MPGSRKTPNWGIILPVGLVSLVGGFLIGSYAGTKQQQPPALVPILKNVANSCYMDSVLTALFSTPDPEIDKIFFEKKFVEGESVREKACSRDFKEDVQIKENLQKQLRKIAAFVRGEQASPATTCVNLRLAIKKCSLDRGERFYSGDMQDAVEFMRYLLSMFGATVALEKQDIFATIPGDEAKDNPQWQQEPVSIKYEAVLPVIRITPVTYTSKNMASYLESVEDSENPATRRKTVITIIDSPLIIFGIERRAPDDITVFKKDVVPPQQFQLPANPEKTFQLKAIVVYAGTYAHYMAYIAKGEQWYKYDDLKTTVAPLGTFAKMLRFAKPRVQNYGTIFVYTLVVP